MWAPHVKGKYSQKQRGDSGFCEPQQVHMLCTYRHEDGKVCGATWQTWCSSGNVRGHINNFAKAHAHSTFENPPRVVRPGSKRSSVLEKQR